jgi:hypothetical protein
LKFDATADLSIRWPICLDKRRSVRAYDVRNNAATTARFSCTRTLYVRHAAGVSMTSKPTPWMAASAMRRMLGMHTELPVPSIMSSGSSARAGSRSASVREMGFETFQSFSKF